MSASIRKYAPHLKIMATSKPGVCAAMVKMGDPGLVRSLCECVINVLKGNVRLTPAQKKRLARYKKDLRFLAHRGKSIASKKRVLQKGGFVTAIPQVLGAALPAVTSLAGKALKYFTGRGKGRGRKKGRRRGRGGKSKRRS